MDGCQLDYHPRPGGVVERVCQLFVSPLDKAEDGQIALVMTPGTILRKRQELCERTLEESLQCRLAKPPRRIVRPLAHHPAALDRSRPDVRRAGRAHRRTVGDARTHDKRRGGATTSGQRPVRLTPSRRLSAPGSPRAPPR